MSWTRDLFKIFIYSAGGHHLYIKFRLVICLNPPNLSLSLAQQKRPANSFLNNWNDF